MAKYDVLDEAVLEATPAEVAAALEDETHGRSHWWRSRMQIEPLDSSRNLHVGATVRFSVHNPTSRVQWGLPRFTGRVTTYEPEHRIVFEFIEGAFRGTGEWSIKVEPVTGLAGEVTGRTVARTAVRLGGRQGTFAPRPRLCGKAIIHLGGPEPRNYVHRSWR